MKVFEVILIACLLHVASCDDEQNILIYPTATIAEPYEIGNNTIIREDVVIGKKSDIGENVTIGPNVFIGINCTINAYNKLRYGVILGDNVQTGPFTSIQPAVTIGNNCTIGKMSWSLVYYAVLDKTTGNYRYTNVSFAARIDDGSIVAALSFIGSFSHIQKYAYIGVDVDIGSMVTVGENSVIHIGCSIPNNTKIEKNTVIVRAPISIVLYRICLPYERVRHYYTERMEKLPSEPVSGVLNLNRMMEIQMNALTDNCENPTYDHFQFTALVISLYLIKFHGIDSFKTNYDHAHRNVTADDNHIPGYVDFVKSNLEKLRNEQHFVDASTNILEPAARDQFVKLLALLQDFERILRVSDDTFCKMFNDIKTGRRTVKLDIELTAPN